MMLEKWYEVILGPQVSEKAMICEEEYGQKIFKVATWASKLDVKNAVEKIFNVKVSKVNVTNCKGKKKGFRKIQGKKSDWKKAYITLESGQEIDLTNLN
jgi:large subunit ribosomal protein L23